MCPINIRRLRILQHLEDILQNQIPILQIPMLTLLEKILQNRRSLQNLHLRPTLN
jgi:hypothetical protein